MALCGGVCVFLCGLLLLLVPVLVPAQVRHPLPVLWMMPVSGGGPDGENLTAAVFPAVRLALQDLQTQPAPLGSYEVQLQLLDSQCDPAAALRALFDAMWAGPRYLLLLGGACPSVTALIGRALPALSLLQVSFVAPPPGLSNRKWYGNVFSTAPSHRAMNQAAVKLLQRHGWKRVGLLTGEGPRSEMKKDLLRQLLKADVQLVSAESLSSDVCSSLTALKDKDVRIIVGQLDDDSVSDVFCCAYRLNMFGARYQWLLLDGAAAGWRLGWRPSGCSADSLLTAADGSFRLQPRTSSSSDTAGVSGRTPQDYQDSYRQLAPQGSKVSALHGFAYDAVWAAARALSVAMETAKLREKLSRNDSVGHEEVHRLMLDAVRHTHFLGVTGPVSFRNGERMTSIELTQFQGGGGVSVGEFSISSQQLRVQSQLVKFKGPGPARDRVLVLEQRLQVGVLLYAAVCSAAAATIVLTVSVLVFSAAHRTLRLRWTSGSQDELLLLLSVLLSSSSVLVSGVGGASLSLRSFEVLCSVRLWTLSVGHTVGHTALLIRAWRLHTLHSNTHTQAVGGGVLLWLLLLDVLVLSSWQILDPLRRVELQQHSIQSDSADQDVVVRLYSELCSCSNMDLWLIAVYGYKAPLLGLGCFVACGARAVQVDPPAVSSKRLSLTVFAVTVFSVSGASASLLTSHNPPVQLCVTSVLILSCNVLALSFLFGPQLLQVCLKGGELQPPSELQGEAADGEDEEKKKEEKKKLSWLNQQLKSQTAQLDVQIETITMQLCDTYEPPAAELQLHHTTRQNNGEVRAVTWAHAVQICPENRNSERKPSSQDGINSPELVRRRLSVQLPILHHSYLPAIGGVSASSSSLFGSQDVFIYHDDNFLFAAQLEPRYL